MTRTLPPLDMHAHIDTAVKPQELEELGAVVFAVCRTLSEFERTRSRADQVAVWGVGCHPGIAESYSEFEVDDFRGALASTPFVGEVGLDKRSKVPRSVQRQTLVSILELISDSPRLVSIHSSGATGEVLDTLNETGVRGAILHWWLGSPEETARAVQLGCYFSINYAMASKGLTAGIPANRILLETDHPYGDRQSSSPRQPGSVQAAEKLVARALAISQDNLRQLQWSNFSTLVDELDVGDLMPAAVQRMLTYARSFRE